MYLMTSISRRSPNHFHTLLQLRHITLDSVKPSNLLLNITYRLKHTINLAVLLLHKHTKVVDRFYCIIVHTSSLAPINPLYECPYISLYQQDHLYS